MALLYFLFLTCATSLSLVFLCLKKKRSVPELLKNTVFLEIAWAGLCFLLGLYFLFNFMEANEGLFLQNLMTEATTLAKLILLFLLFIAHLSIALIILLQRPPEKREA